MNRPLAPSVPPTPPLQPPPKSSYVLPAGVAFFIIAISALVVVAFSTRRGQIDPPRPTRTVVDTVPPSVPPSWVVIYLDPPMRCFRIRPSEFSASGTGVFWRSGDERVFLSGHYIAVQVVSDSWEGALALAGLTLEQCLQIERERYGFFQGHITRGTAP